ncbi:MAG: ORF6N domain-containing protein [Desulfobacterales bacterium]|nr:ORF6N domain-containing protein [Desulfobacterales bacterium]
MAKKRNLTPIEKIEKLIFLVRGQKIMLSTHLAELYGVESRVLVQAVKRNIERFPEDFMFQLSDGEFENLKSQFVISSWGGMRRAKPYAFTEQGVAMLSSVLRSKRAVLVNIEIMRSFVKLREMLATHKDLDRKLTKLERKYDDQFKVVFEVIRQLMAPPDKKVKKIGFTVKEKQKAYGKSVKKKKPSTDGSFTPKAKKIWEAIPGIIQFKILNNVWCVHCRKESSIGNLSGKIESGMLVLRGTCTKCGDDVARVIENE